MKFEFNLPSRNNILMRFQYERKWLNDQVFSLIALGSLGLTYQVKIFITLASTVLKKSTFPKKSHLNALGSKSDLDVK